MCMKFFANIFKSSTKITETPTLVVTPEKPMSEPVISSNPQVDIFSKVALPLILVFEGGYTNHPADKGGPTNYGVTQKVYDEYQKEKGVAPNSVQSIPMFVVEDIYRTKYWMPAKCDQMPEKLSVAVFDTTVNSGAGRSIKLLQQAIGATVDGVIGSETISKLKSFDPIELAGKYLDTREGFYRGIVQRDPTQQVFLKGWLRRLQFVRDYIGGKKTVDQIKKEW